jgi:hypothetical protein
LNSDKARPEKPAFPWLWLLPAVAGILTVAFCIYYLTRSHLQLREDYLRLVRCMYRQPLWEEGFFNQETKTAGNRYAVIGLISGCALAAWSWLWRRKLSPGFGAIIGFAAAHRYSLLLLSLITGILWLWGFKTSVPAYDEVFSAVNCANVHPVQTVAYYMLPNNHILFNLINNLLFHPVYDKVLTGRIISGIAQLAFAALMYWWLFKMLNSRLYALLYTTLILLQFPVWGFSFQARGYGLYLLCAMAGIIGLTRYFKDGSRLWLGIHMLAVITGFCIMPSFLFWYVGMMCVAAGYFVRKRHVDMLFLGTQAFAAMCIYCFYLPGICYSGLSAFTDNQYVRILPTSWTDYWPQLGRDINATIQYSFGGNVDARSTLYTVLFYAPLLMAPLLYRSRVAPVLFINICIWIVFFLLQLKFRHYPFMRNMIAHVSLALCALLLGMHELLDWLGRKIKARLVLPVFAVAFCLISGVHFIRFMRGHVHDSLYFYDARSGYDLPRATIQHIPVNARVWCSDQSFYLQYLLKRRGSGASHCMEAAQTYFITDRNEGVPQVPGIRIAPVDSVLQYVIYKVQ